MASVISELSYDPNDSPYIVGTDQEALFLKIKTFMDQWPVGLNFIGEPGSGKTHMGKELVKQYGREHGVPAYYAVVDEQTTKSSLLLGRQIQNGSLETVVAVVGRAMQTGGAVYVDEITHGPISVQSAFNTILDQDSATSVGDILLQAHPLFRFISGHNPWLYAGNVGLKTSYASRLKTYNFEYPDPRTETMIAKSIVMKVPGGPERLKNVPDSVLKYLVSWSRGVREFTRAPGESSGSIIPVSARNVAYAVMGLSGLLQDSNAKLLPKFTAGSSSQAIREMTAERVLFAKPKDDADLLSSKVNNVFAFISRVGEANFIEEVMSASMCYLPLEGVVPSLLKNYREQMISSLI